MDANVITTKRITYFKEGDNMFLFSKSKRMVNIVLDDYVIRIAVSKGNNLESIKLLEEREVPLGLIEHGKIIDEMKFYEWMKELIREMGLRRHPVRFYVPNSLVIMRHVTIPEELIGEGLHEYFYTEIGKSIHLPFQEALFDVFVPKVEGHKEVETNEQQKRGVLFAAPEEEINKYMTIFADVSLRPEAVDIEPLGVYRYFFHLYERKKDVVSLFFEMNLTSYHLSIFHHHIPEFIRHQYLDIQTSAWKITNKNSNLLTWEYHEKTDTLLGELGDHITELGRIMDFYRYSLYKGEKKVDEIIVHGDYPDIEKIVTKLKEQYDIPVKLLQAYMSESHDKEVDIRFIPVLGLALKGERIDAPRD